MRHSDPHEVLKDFIESEMIAGRNPPRIMSELTPENELRGKLCEALGWIRGPQGWQRTEASWPSALSPLDHNLIAVAREKLLTTDRLKNLFNSILWIAVSLDLTEQCAEWQHDYMKINASPIQQARAILEAIKS